MQVHCNGPQPLTRTARPTNAVPSFGPRRRARSPMKTWPQPQPRTTSAGRLWPPSADSSLAPQRPHYSCNRFQRRQRNDRRSARAGHRHRRLEVACSQPSFSRV
eukprot:3889444-Prymnesium_polylepis.1